MVEMTTRKRKGGSLAYMARIRVMQGNDVVHKETQTFGRGGAGFLNQSLSGVFRRSGPDTGANLERTMTIKTRRKHRPPFKAKVALKAVHSERTVADAHAQGVDVLVHRGRLVQPQDIGLAGLLNPMGVDVLAVFWATCMGIVGSAAIFSKRINQYDASQFQRRSQCLASASSVVT